MSLLTELKEAVSVISAAKEVVAELKELFGVDDSTSLLSALAELKATVASATAAGVTATETADQTDPGTA